MIYDMLIMFAGVSVITYLITFHHIGLMGNNIMYSTTFSEIGGSSG